MAGHHWGCSVRHAVMFEEIVLTASPVYNRLVVGVGASNARRCSRSWTSIVNIGREHQSRTLVGCRGADLDYVTLRRLPVDMGDVDAISSISCLM